MKNTLQSDIDRLSLPSLAIAAATPVPGEVAAAAAPPAAAGEGPPRQTVVCFSWASCALLSASRSNPSPSIGSLSLEEEYFVQKRGFSEPSSSSLKEGFFVAAAAAAAGVAGSRGARPGWAFSPGFFFDDDDDDSRSTSASATSSTPARARALSFPC